MQLPVAGDSIYLQTEGDPDGAVVIFVHGSGATHIAWQAQLAGLTSSGRFLVAPDLPGHGQSGGQLLASIGAMADWLEQLLDAIGRQRATIVGHSMGALVALEFAAQHGARADAIILLGVVPRMAVNADLLSAAQANDPLAAKLVASWSCRKSPDSAAVKLESEQRLLAAGPGVLWQDLNACDSYRDSRLAAAAVRCPVTIISGEEDRMTPAVGGAELAALIAESKYYLLQEAGHNMMLEQPQRLNELLNKELR